MLNYLLAPFYKHKKDLIFTNYLQIVYWFLYKKYLKGYTMIEWLNILRSDCGHSFQRFAGILDVLTKLIEGYKSAWDSGKMWTCSYWTCANGFIAYTMNYPCVSSLYMLYQEACNLILCYLRNRLRRVNITSVKSDWSFIMKWVLKGPLQGPHLFDSINLFLNDDYFVLSHSIYAVTMPPVGLSLLINLILTFLLQNSAGISGLVTTRWMWNYNTFRFWLQVIASLCAHKADLFCMRPTVWITDLLTLSL